MIAKTEDETMEQDLFEHRHGGMAKLDMRRLGVKDRDVIDFSVNLNPLGPPEIIKESWHELVSLIEPYPSIHGDGILDYYVSRFGINEGCIISGNGSTELIYLIPRALNLNSSLILVPSYNDYQRACAISGTKILIHIMEPDVSGDYDFSVIESYMNKVDSVWLGRPNNPTGWMIPVETILNLSKAHLDKWFIVDEAFIQFVDGWEKKSLLTTERPENIVLLHSLTKFYALAGLRMGAVIGAPRVMDSIRRIKEPWTVNGIADAISRLLIKTEEYELMSNQFIQYERKRVFKELKSLNSLEVYPTSANFFLLKWNSEVSMDSLIKYLLENGVYVRDCRNFYGLNGDFFRIGLRKREENDLLISLLKSF